MLPQMRRLREENVNFEHVYFDKDRKYAFSSVIAVSDYKQKK